MCAFLSSDDFFSKASVSKSVLDSLDPDQARHFVRPDLGSNCLQRLPADDTCRRRIK